MAEMGEESILLVDDTDVDAAAVAVHEELCVDSLYHCHFSLPHLLLLCVCICLVASSFHFRMRMIISVYIMLMDHPEEDNTK